MSTRRISVLGAALALQLAIQAPLAFATDPAVPAGSYDCNHLPPQVDSHTTAACAAAKSAQDAANKNKTLEMVYAGVTGVCIAACVSMQGWTQTCQYSSLGAAGVDMVMTKNFGAAISALPLLMNHGDMGAVKSLYTTQVTEKVEGIEVTKEQGHGNKEACLTAAISGLQMYMKSQAAKAAEDSADSTLATIPEFSNRGSGVYSQASLGSMNSGNLAAGSSGSGPSGIGGSSTCAQGASTGNAGAVAQCAAATDGTLSKVVSDPNFYKDLQKATGMSPSDFFAKVGSDGAAAALAGALGSSSGLGVDGGSLSKVLAAMEAQSGAETGTMYASSGARGSKGGGSDDEFGKSMTALLAKLGAGAEDGKKAQAALSESKAERFPASVSEDRGVSLFDRVTYRYHLVTPRLISAADAMPAPADQNSISQKGAPSQAYRSQSLPRPY